VPIYMGTSKSRMLDKNFRGEVKVARRLIELQSSSAQIATSSSAVAAPTRGRPPRS
jgi:hypothetical protein